jgi:hypothetical protein
MGKWAPGYTQAELDAAQERHQLSFPPDLVDLFLERRPAEGYNWAGDDGRITKMLRWPLDMLLLDVDHGSWWVDWGDRPQSVEERHEIVRSVLGHAPRLIPVLGHRFIPETPQAAGNPVFSMHGFDTIYYGANLDEYFTNEFGGTYLLNGVAQSDYTLEDTLALRLIPFWSDLALHWNRRVQLDDDG